MLKVSVQEIQTEEVDGRTIEPAGGNDQEGVVNGFVVGLLAMNIGACSVFLYQRNWPWAMIYFGASLIQAGCLWVNR